MNPNNDMNFHWFVFFALVTACLWWTIIEAVKGLIWLVKWWF